jgi:hypothetical protein
MYSERFGELEQPKFNYLDSPVFSQAKEVVVKKILTAEHALNAIDIEALATVIKEEVKKVTAIMDDSKEQITLVSQMLSVENLITQLGRSGYKIESQAVGEDPDGGLSTNVTWNDVEGIRHQGSFSSNDLEAVLSPIRRAVIDKMNEDLDLKKKFKEQEKFNDLNTEGFNTARAKIEAKFLTSEQALDSRDIEAFANVLKEEIKKVVSATDNTEERASLILYMLNAESIFSQLKDSGYVIKGSDNPEEMYDEKFGLITHVDVNDYVGEDKHNEFYNEDVEAALYHMRKAVIDKISQDLDTKTVHLVTRALSKNQRVFELHDQKILKLSKDYYEGYIQEPKEKSNRMEALRELYSVRERSPHIAYVVLEVERTIEAHEGREVQKKMEMKTLEDLLKEKNEIPYKKMLTYVLHGMKGAEFLVKHNLRLTDFVPKNIGVDLNLDKGFLFDFDGLRKKDVSVDYPAHSGNKPPERKVESFTGDQYTDVAQGDDKKSEKKPIEESEMVYELGCLLETVRGAYGASLKQADLFTSMKDLDPEKRPKLEEVVVALEKEIDELQTN